MKFGVIHPKPETYEFDTADAFVDFGQQHNMFIVGHTLVWHSQTGRWVFQDENGDDAGETERDGASTHDAILPQAHGARGEHLIFQLVIEPDIGNIQHGAILRPQVHPYHLLPHPSVPDSFPLDG